MNSASLLRRRKTGTMILSTALAAVLLVPGLLQATNRTWDGGATGVGTNWTASGGGNWNPDGVPTAADNLTLDSSIVQVPAVTTTTNDFGALTIIFSNNFNSSNTTVFGSSSTLVRTMTLGSAGSQWTLANNATGGSVTFQPTTSGGTVAMVINLANSGTMTVAGGGSLVITTVIGNSAGSFGITKVGQGILTLGATNNTYGGGTSVLAGGLFASANGALGTGAVNVALTGTLTLAATATNAIADGATLTLDGVLSLAGAAGGSQETVGGLVIGGVARAPGTYGATGSGATNIDNAHFSGTGVLTVVPEPGVNALLAAAAGALGLVARRRRSSRSR